MCGAATVCIGIIGLAGNLFHLPILQSILVNKPTMKLATSVGLILCGCSLLVSAIYTLKTEFRLLMQTFFSVSAGILTVGILLKYLSVYYGSLHDPATPNFDELDSFLPSFGSLAAFSVYITAIIYRVIGTILDWKCTASVVSGAFVAGLGLTSLIGYITNTPILFWNNDAVSTGMAIHTALAFLLLGTGLMVRPNKLQLICK